MTQKIVCQCKPSIDEESKIPIWLNVEERFILDKDNIRRLELCKSIEPLGLFYFAKPHVSNTQGKIDGKMLKGKGWLPSLNICSIERGFTYTLVWFHFLFPRFFFKFPDVSVYVLKFPARFFFQMKFPGSP